MALIGNRSVYNKSPGRFLSGTAISGDRSEFSKHGMVRSAFQALTDPTSAWPTGARAPVSWVMAKTTNALSARYSGDILLSASGAASMGLPAEGSVALALTATATIGAFVPTPAEGQGSCSISLSATLQTGAIGWISGAIVPYTELSPQSLANAVWSAIASDYLDAGTMGQKLNGAGSAGNPWTEVIEAGLSAAEILRIILAVQAGQTTITPTGTGTADVAFKAQNGTTDRVLASMTGSERTTVLVEGN